MEIRFPAPLPPGARIGVTSTSAGVGGAAEERIDFCVDWLRGRGYDVVVGECMAADAWVCAPKEQRAAELTAMLCDPTIAAVVPPWGGELGIDLLDQLDWAALEQAEPTWLVGFSDTSLLLVALTTRLGWGTLHGANLMDTRYDPPAGLLHWVDVASATGPVTQRSPGRYRTGGWDDYARDPEVRTMTLDATGTWSVLGGGGVDVTGRLVGGCIEIMGPIAGTPYGDVPAFGREHADEGLVVYLEACEDGPYTIARTLHGLRLAGWFDHANAVLVGRTGAPDLPAMSQREAVADALGGLDVPVVLDVECGHVQPFLPLVNGARARVVVDGTRHEVVQEW